MSERKTGSKPMIGIIVERGLKQALADEAWRQRKTQSEFAREILVDGLRRRGVEIEAVESVAP